MAWYVAKSAENGAVLTAIDLDRVSAWRVMKDETLQVIVDGYAITLKQMDSSTVRRALEEKLPRQ